MSREAVISAWAHSGVTSKVIAATLARELPALPPATRVTSSMKIAARFNTSNTTAVRARYHLLAQKIIRKNGRHYYVA